MARIKHYNRKTNKWEYADSSFTVGGNIDYYEQPEAPDDAPVGSLWYDTDEMPPEESGGISITGATVGQTVKISAVDENGVPTAWLPTDFPSGGGSGGEWEKIIDFTISEQVGAFEVSTGIDGNPFELTELIVWFKQAVIEKGSYPYFTITTNNGNALPAMNWGVGTSFKTYGAYVKLHADGSAHAFSADLNNLPRGAANIEPLMNLSSVGGAIANFGNGISSFKIHANNQLFAVGTRLILYGVRA